MRPGGKFWPLVLQRRRLTPDHRRDVESSHPATLPRPERRQETPLAAGTDDGLTCQELLQFDNDRPVIDRPKRGGREPPVQAVCCMSGSLRWRPPISRHPWFDIVGNPFARAQSACYHFSQSAVSPWFIRSSLDEFKINSGLVFKNEKEAAKAFEVYQDASRAEKGIVIGHDLDPLNQCYNGWQAFRMKAVDWTEEINMSWIDGAVDAGKPVLVATPFDKIRIGSITWKEMSRVVSRGGKVVFER